MITKARARAALLLTALFVITSLTLAIMQARPRSSVMSGAASTAPAIPARK